MVRELPGPVFELGLGNGRTFDHLRTLTPEREIYVFDSVIVEQTRSALEPERLIVGDVRGTLPAFLANTSRKAALIHNDLDDIGGNSADQQRALCYWLSPLIRDAAAPGAVVVSNTRLDLDDWNKIQLPDGHAPDRYFMYQRPCRRSERPDRPPASL